MRKKINDSGNKEIHTELAWYDMLIAAMIELSLEDYCKPYPRLINKKYNLYYLFSKYYPECKRIDVLREQAAFFFDSPKSLFNKYYQLDKEYLIRHYKEKHNKDARKSKIQ